MVSPWSFYKISLAEELSSFPLSQHPESELSRREWQKLSAPMKSMHITWGRGPLHMLLVNSLIPPHIQWRRGLYEGQILTCMIHQMSSLKTTTVILDFFSKGILYIFNHICDFSHWQRNMFSFYLNWIVWSFLCLLILYTHVANSRRQIKLYALAF